MVNSADAAAPPVAEESPINLDLPITVRFCSEAVFFSLDMLGIRSEIFLNADYSDSVGDVYLLICGPEVIENVDNLSFKRLESYASFVAEKRLDMLGITRRVRVILNIALEPDF